MNRIVLKIAFFMVLVAAVCAFNSFVINGPLLQNNIDIGVKQFSGGKTLDTAGDFKVAGYWMSFNTVYIIEVVFLALMATMLFASHITALFVPEPKKK